MQEIFQFVLTTSLYASLVGFVIICFKRILNNKLDARWHYLIWLILIIKLLFPFGPQSIISLFNAVPEIPKDSLVVAAYQVERQYQQVMSQAEILPRVQSEAPKLSIAKAAVIGESMLPYIWVAGMLIMTLWLMVSYWILFKRLAQNSYKADARIQQIYETCKTKLEIPKEVSILIQNTISMPSLYGGLKPTILLPASVVNLSNKELEYIILHELAHYKRKDIYTNYLLLILQTIHWFNPVMWYCFNKIRQDMEVATDQYVLSVLERAEYKEYGKTLITILERFAAPNLAPKLLGMADDKKSIERRLKMIKMADFFKGKRKVAVIIGLLCIAILSGILLTNGLTKDAKNEIQQSDSSLYNIEELYNNKTKYVGAHNKVGMIAHNLPYGSIMKSLALQTKSEPYGATVIYDTTKVNLDRAAMIQRLPDNAAVMFALIDNVSYLTFQIDDAGRSEEYKFSREEIQKGYDRDLREFAKSKDELMQLVESIYFKVFASPEKYSPAMSSTPGIRLLAIYDGGQVAKVRYQAKGGRMFTWNTSSGKISDASKTLELSYKEEAYWSPIIENSLPGLKSEEITITLLNESGKQIAQRKVVFQNEEGLTYTVKPALGIVTAITAFPEPATQTIEEAVSRELKAQANSYKDGEVGVEGHVILDTEAEGKTVKVYTVVSDGAFGFENGIFTKVGGSGAVPTVITFEKGEDGRYHLLKYETPKDGTEYVPSIKKMFPSALQNKVLNFKQNGELAQQQEAQAKAYLDSIGRKATVSIAFVEKKLLDINVQASNKLFAELTKYDNFLNTCPYWIGTKEQIEGGIRYIYATAQEINSSNNDLVVFTKTKEDGTIIKHKVYEIIGSEPKLIIDK